MDPQSSCTNLERHTQEALQAAQKMASTIQEALNKSSSQLSQPSAVLWRTPGFHANSTQMAINSTLHVHKMIKDFIQEDKRTLKNTTGSSALGVIDWGTAVLPRSFYPDRVHADIDSHYSLEPRLLMAQMTTQQLMNILGKWNGS